MGGPLPFKENDRLAYSKLEMLRFETTGHEEREAGGARCTRRGAKVMDARRRKDVDELSHQRLSTHWTAAPELQLEVPPWMPP